MIKRIKRATDVVNESPLVVSPVIGAYCGWLAPDGKFYACESWEHESFAWRLTEMLGIKDHYNAGRELEAAGWVKLKSGDWMVICREDVSQRQLDALFDWALAKKLTLGDVFMDEERVLATKLKTPM